MAAARVAEKKAGDWAEEETESAEVEIESVEVETELAAVENELAEEETELAAAEMLHLGAAVRLWKRHLKAWCRAPAAAAAERHRPGSCTCTSARQEVSHWSATTL